MRVAQKFAGYTLADADLLRKACGKKNRELIAIERQKFVDGVERTGYGAPSAPTCSTSSSRSPTTRSTRATPTGTASSPTRPRTSRRTTRSSTSPACSPASRARSRRPRSTSPSAGRWASGCSPPTSTARSPTSPPSSPARCPTRSTCPRRSPGAITFGLSAVRNVGEGLVELLLDRARGQRPVRRLPRVRRAGARTGAQQARRRVADQGRRLRLARAHAPGPARRVRAHHRHHARTPPRTRAGRDEPVRRRRGSRRATARSTSGCRSPTSSSTRRPAAQREGDARAVRVATTRCSASRRRCAARSTQSIGDLAELDDGATVRVGGVVTGLTRQVHQEGRPDGGRSCLEDLEGDIEVTLFPRTLPEHGHKLADDIDRRGPAAASTSATRTASASSCQDIEVLDRARRRPGADAHAAHPRRRSTS